MRLPPQIDAFLNDAIQNADEAALLSTARQLSSRYNAAQPKGNGDPLLAAQADVLAYALSRMPATYAALCRALEIALPQLPGKISHVLDVGAGPGTASLAVLSHFAPEQISLIERDANMVALGKQLLAQLPADETRFFWTQGEMQALALPRADLVIAAYSLLELDLAAAEQMVQRLFHAAEQALLIVEPGTPAGHARLKNWAALLAPLGAHIASPCPMATFCPIVGDDWCAFTARVERSALHRRMKGGSLAYEDEKFSFLLITKQAASSLPAQRIRRHPIKHKGRVELSLCGNGSLQTLQITKASPLYKAARKAEYGDPWPPLAETTKGDIEE